MIYKNIIRDLNSAFRISKEQIEEIIQAFNTEMNKGLQGKKSTLKMIPSFTSKPTGKEKGEFIAIDLGGTNFRILNVKLVGNGKTGRPGIEKYTLKKSQITGTAGDLFGFIADCIDTFIKKYKMNSNTIDLGFTFSFPVVQKSISSGYLKVWTKGFSADGVEGKDIIKLLNNAIRDKGIKNVKVNSLVNDTVGTLVTYCYKDSNCDIGVIIGTGTNACYSEKLSNIKKMKGYTGKTGEMIINIEWGNFNKLPLTDYDMQLDRESINPGEQVLEKMVSGMYLGELVLYIVKDIIKRNSLFGGVKGRLFNKKGIFTSEHMSLIERDSTDSLSRINKLLIDHGIKKTKKAERIILKDICEIISKRAALISAVVLIAVVKKIDSSISKKHTIAIDGSIYEKYYCFSNRIKKNIRQICGSKSKNISIKLSKDGSGMGAAIIAAITKYSK